MRYCIEESQNRFDAVRRVAATDTPRETSGVFFIEPSARQNQHAIDKCYEIFQYICGYRNHPVLRESDCSMKGLLTEVRRIRVDEANGRKFDIQGALTFAACAEFEQLLQADLLEVISDLDRPVLLSEVRIQGAWYAITGDGLRVIEQRRHAQLAQSGSVHKMLTWQRASLPVTDIEAFFTKLVRRHQNSPVAAIAAVYSKIAKHVLVPYFRDHQAKRRSRSVEAGMLA